MVEEDDFGGYVDCNIPEPSKLTEVEAARETASFALVGRYMQSFSLLEKNIADAIQGILDIESVERFVLVDPIPFNGKLNILESFAEWHSSVDEHWRHEARKLIKRMRSVSDDRNLLAHSVFVPLEHEVGLMFHRSGARNQAVHGSERWSLRDGEEKIGRIATLSTDLKTFTENLPGLRSSLREAVRENPGIFSGGSGNYGGGLLAGHSGHD